ncbi:hypothetical protein L249_6942 [Ophiocordyceps polyrhachis-furcata BCC 54312]|uniref:Uncharacterized protein n=1 Tax=Ophiocordyceps polyrhachis-furcata BCC 54312 TaxID=1330021 RepID=A0A367LL73_9HYPO|nr:hypothetical protein L249_6942 [Ophiocordyceps polyrhachis-furcata BCC 54312]
MLSNRLMGYSDPDAQCQLSFQPLSFRSSSNLQGCTASINATPRRRQTCFLDHLRRMWNCDILTMMGVFFGRTLRGLLRALTWDEEDVISAELVHVEPIINHTLPPATMQCDMYVMNYSSDLILGISLHRHYVWTLYLYMDMQRSHCNITPSRSRRTCVDQEQINEVNRNSLLAHAAATLVGRGATGLKLSNDFCMGKKYRPGVNRLQRFHFRNAPCILDGECLSGRCKAEPSLSGSIRGLYIVCSIFDDTMFFQETLRLAYLSTYLPRRPLNYLSFFSPTYVPGHSTEARFQFNFSCALEKETVKSMVDSHCGTNPAPSPPDGNYKQGSKDV